MKVLQTAGPLKRAATQHHSLLCKLVAEVDKVLPSGGQLLSEEWHCGAEYSSHSRHIGALVPHSLHAPPRHLRGGRVTAAVQQHQALP